MKVFSMAPQSTNGKKNLQVGGLKTNDGKEKKNRKININKIAE